jgi:hypothetical protein
MWKRTFWFISPLFLLAGIAWAAGINTSARCSSGASCEIGGGVATSFQIDTDGTGGEDEFIAPDITFEAFGDSIQNTAAGEYTFQKDESGNVTLLPADSDANTQLTVTATGTGNLLLTTDGAGAVTVGDSVTTTLTLTNNGAMALGNATTTDSLALATAGAITIGTAAADTVTIAATGAFDIGNNVATAVTIDTDGTGDGELVLPSESVSNGEITNIVRSIPLPLNVWWPCNADGLLESDDAADAFPDFGRGSGLGTAMSHVIQWDVTGGSVDTEEICVTVNVPQDYASGSAFHVTFLDTATNDHDYDEFTLVQSPDSPEDTSTAVPTLGLGTGASTTTTVCDGATTASDLFVCTWTTEAVAIGDTLVFGFGPTAGDTEALTMFGAEWRYTAVQ